MVRTFVLTFDGAEDSLCSWLEKIGPSSVRRILAAIHTSATCAEDTTNLLDVIKDGVASVLPTQNVIELERLQERHRVTAECQQSLLEKQDVIEGLQVEIGELQRDAIVNRNKLEQSEHVNDKIILQKELEWRDNHVIDSRVIAEIETMLSRALDKFPAVTTSIDFTRELIEGPLKKIERYVDKFETKCSVDKGRAMEDKYHRLLQRQLPDYEIELVRDTPHEMDLRVTNGQFSVLIDIKNYSHNVTTKELVKFDNDVRTNRLPSVLVSSMSGVANKKHFQIDFVDSRYPVCYLSNVKDDIDQVVSAITIVGSLNQFASSQSTGVRLDSNSVKRIIDRLHQVSATLKEMTDLNEQQKRLIRKIHVGDIVELVCGQLAGDSVFDRHREDFVRKCVVKSDERGARFTIREAIRIWKANPEQFGNPPKQDNLKRGLEIDLRTKSISKRIYEGNTEVHVFEGWMLKDMQTLP